MLKKVFKSGALFFAVGIALALVAPVLATALGPALLGDAAVAQAVATPVMWTGAFFGTFGAINTVLTPVFDRLFGDKTPASSHCSHEADKSAASAHACGMDLERSAPARSHCDALAAQRQHVDAQHMRG